MVMNEIGLCVFGILIQQWNFNDTAHTNKLGIVLLDCHRHIFGAFNEQHFGVEE